jgi:hypothetical protein
MRSRPAGYFAKRCGKQKNEAAVEPFRRQTVSHKMRIIITLILAVCCLPAAASLFAQQSGVYKSQNLRGPVKSVTVSSQYASSELMEFNSDHHLTHRRHLSGGRIYSATSVVYTYDKKGRLLKEREGSSSNDNARQLEISYTYDKTGRLTGELHRSIQNSQNWYGQAYLVIVPGIKVQVKWLNRWQSGELSSGISIVDRGSQREIRINRPDSTTQHVFRLSGSDAHRLHSETYDETGENIVSTADIFVSQTDSVYVEEDRTLRHEKRYDRSGNEIEHWQLARDSSGKQVVVARTVRDFDRYGNVLKSAVQGPEYYDYYSEPVPLTEASALRITGIAYEYDAYGNWTKKTVNDNGNETVISRAISYYDN